MLFIWVVFFVSLGIFAIAYYFVSIATEMCIAKIVTDYPSYFDPRVNTFMTNIWLWLPAIFIFALLLWVYKNSQKPEGLPGYE